MPRIDYVFLCKQYIKVIQNTFQHGQLRHPGLPVSYLPLQLPQPYFGAGTPSPRTSAAIRAGKVVLEGGRKVYVVLTTFVGPDPELYMTVHDYTYSFHPAGVVHLYPVATNPARSDPTFSEAPINKTNGYDTILLPVWGASSLIRSPGAVKQSRMESPWILRSGAQGLAHSP